MTEPLSKESMRSGNVYRCGHCGFEGPCYGNGFSAPWCFRCGMNDKLTSIQSPKTNDATKETKP